MTRITGCDAHAPETVSTSCGSADKRRNRLRLRKPCPHLADGQIGFAPALPTEGCSHHPGMMGAGDIRVSVEQTEARISDTSRMVMASPPGTPNGHGIVSSGVRESNPRNQFGRLRH